MNGYVEQQFYDSGASSWDGFYAEGLIKWGFGGSKDEQKAMKKVAKINAKTGALEILADPSKGPEDKRVSMLHARQPSRILFTYLHKILGYL